MCQRILLYHSFCTIRGHDTHMFLCLKWFDQLFRSAASERQKSTQTKSRLILTETTTCREHKRRPVRAGFYRGRRRPHGPEKRNLLVTWWCRCANRESIYPESSCCRGLGTNRTSGLFWIRETRIRLQSAPLTIQWSSVKAAVSPTFFNFLRVYQKSRMEVFLQRKFNFFSFFFCFCMTT